MLKIFHPSGESRVGRIRCVAGHSQYLQYGVMARRLAAAAGSTREMSGMEAAPHG
jgi:hypothetical protein